MSPRTPWLTCVIPTIGRDTLHRTLESIYAQRESRGVEVIVVGDTFGGKTPELERAEKHVIFGNYRWLEHDAGLHCVGQPQRTAGAKAAKAPYVWFSQDDNIAAQGSLAAIKQCIGALDKPRPMFFRFLSHWGATIWRSPTLALGNIDADCLVFPRWIAKTVEWGMRYEGDYDAAVKASELAAGDVAWCDQVVSISRPRPDHLWWTG